MSLWTESLQPATRGSRTVSITSPSSSAIVFKVIILCHAIFYTHHHMHMGHHSIGSQEKPRIPAYDSPSSTCSLPSGRGEPDDFPREIAFSRVGNLTIDNKVALVQFRTGFEPRTAEPNCQFGFKFGTQGRTEQRFGSGFGVSHNFPNRSGLSSNPNRSAPLYP